MTETIITPHHKLWSVDFKEIWRYRDLIELFVKRNIVVQYKQTILGPLWYLIQPILTPHIEWSTTLSPLQPP